MKRFLTLSVAIIMAAMLALTSFAAAVPSPTPSPVPSPVPSPAPKDPVITTAPEVSEVVTENKEWSGSIEITTYADRGTLEASVKEKIEAAYNKVKDVKDLGTVHEGVADIADELKVETTNLVVAQVFDISANNAENADHGKLTITVDVASVKNFIGVMHYENDEWKYVDNEIDGTAVTFSVDSLSPFMILTHDGTVEHSMSTGAVVGIVIGGVAVVAVVAVVVFIIVKKKAADEE